MSFLLLTISPNLTKTLQENTKNKSNKHCNNVVRSLIKEIKYLFQKNLHLSYCEYFKTTETNIPIRPVVNNIIAPAYKIAKFPSPPPQKKINLRNTLLLIVIV